MDQIEAYRQIVQLQSEIVKISERNSALKKKCSELELELTQKRLLQPAAGSEEDLKQEPTMEAAPAPNLPRTLAKYTARVFAFLRPPRNLPA